ncbi:MAG: hypothetical protein JNL39_07560 [Opitutaceae bacterium]|nr:hypothetical protein [Opitutaceae bacterium]
MKKLVARLPRLPAAVGAIVGALVAWPASALTITFDFTYDTSGFFSGANAARRDVLQSAAAEYSSRLTDTLNAIVPAQGNAWTATFANPSSPAATVSLSDLAVPANTLVIYVGAANLGAGVLAQGQPGGYSANGNSNWLNNVSARGQTGALGLSPTDFGPWGGAISFNSATAWHTDASPATVEPFPGQYDLYTVALREIGHVLGLGTAPSWFTNLSGAGGVSLFGGANAVAAFGGPVPLAPGNSHWQAGTLSAALGTGNPQAAVLNQDLAAGARSFLTALDAAALQDVGWTVVPEVSTFAWAAFIGAAGWWRWRRGRKGCVKS